MNDEAFDLARFWLEGGIAMYPVLALGLVAEGLGAAALLTRKSALALAALGFSMLPLCLGVIGQAVGRQTVDQAIGMANPDDRELIRDAGYKEAARPLQLGGVLSLLTLPTAAVGLLVSRKRSSELTRLVE